MRFLALLVTMVATSFASVPAELATAMERFRADPPPGWSFTQTTVGEGRSTVERSDAAKPEFDRWSLIKKDGRAPSPAEAKDYAEARSRRSRTGTAPKIIDQFFLEGLEIISDTADRAIYRCPLRPGESRDKTALALRATITVHKPTHTIESIQLANLEPFAPTFGVNIAELKTVMTYSLPTAETPSLPQNVATQVRGKAFILKTLDADMTVTFSDYTKVGKR